MTRDPLGRPPMWKAILTDSQFWIPVGTLVVGILILFFVSGS